MIGSRQSLPLRSVPATNSIHKLRPETKATIEQTLSDTRATYPNCARDLRAISRVRSYGALESRVELLYSRCANSNLRRSANRIPACHNICIEANVPPRYTVTLMWSEIHAVACHLIIGGYVSPIGESAATASHNTNYHTQRDEDAPRTDAVDSLPRSRSGRVVARQLRKTY